NEPHRLAAAAHCHARHFLFARALAHCWNALTASVDIGNIRAPARVVTVSVRPRDICSARWALGMISSPERLRYSSICAWLMIGLLPSTCSWISSLLDHCAALSA